MRRALPVYAAMIAARMREQDIAWHNTANQLEVQELDFNELAADAVNAVKILEGKVSG